MSSAGLMGSLTEGTALAKGGGRGGEGERAREGNNGQEDVDHVGRVKDEDGGPGEVCAKSHVSSPSFHPPPPPPPQTFWAYVRSHTHAGAGRPPGWRRQRGREMTPKCCCCPDEEEEDEEQSFWRSHLGSPQYNWNDVLIKIDWRTQTAQQDRFYDPDLRPLVAAPHPALRQT